MVTADRLAGSLTILAYWANRCWRSTLGSPTEGAELNGKPSEPTKEYRARIWVKLSDDFLPYPLLSKKDLEIQLREALGVGTADSLIVSVTVNDPR